MSWFAAEAVADAAAVSVPGAALNLLLVALGNIVGGSPMVTLVYYSVYLRPGALAAVTGVSAAPPRPDRYGTWNAVQAGPRWG
ncbi:hypothetical protein [Nocardiopsis nanhaiensis]